MSALSETNTKQSIAELEPLVGFFYYCHEPSQRRVLRKGNSKPALISDANDAASNQEIPELTAVEKGRRVAEGYADVGGRRIRQRSFAGNRRRPGIALETRRLI